MEIYSINDTYSLDSNTPWIKTTFVSESESPSLYNSSSVNSLAMKFSECRVVVAVLLPSKRSAFYNISQSWWLRLWCTTWLTNVIARGTTSWFKFFNGCFWTEGTCGSRYCALNIFHIVRHWHKPAGKIQGCLSGLLFYMFNRRAMANRVIPPDKYTLNLNVQQIYFTGKIILFKLSLTANILPRFLLLSGCLKTSSKSPPPFFFIKI